VGTEHRQHRRADHAEINAGVDLTVKLRRDGVSTPLDGKAADNSDISSPYDKTVAATFGGAPIS
jgi:hypothetical protein